MIFPPWAVPRLAGTARTGQLIAGNRAQHEVLVVAAST
jgi:hypothetical protein